MSMNPHRKVTVAPSTHGQLQPTPLKARCNKGQIQAIATTVVDQANASVWTLPMLGRRASDAARTPPIPNVANSVEEVPGNRCGPSDSRSVPAVMLEPT